jgi:hypothetical protein
MLRLFERGHLEEPRFIDWLELAGARVRYIDWERSTRLFYHSESDCYMLVAPGEPAPGGGADWPDDVSDIEWHVMCAKARGIELPEPKQFGFTALYGHFSGSMDGLATGVDATDYWGRHPAQWDVAQDEEILAEFKTHNAKQFAKLIDPTQNPRGVKGAKPEHYGQMVTYMEEKKLPLGLYCAVNKDTDDLYYEFVKPDPEHAAELKAKALAILTTKTHPARISNSPTFWKCGFCDHRPTCHKGEPMAVNCRTCRFSQPVDNAGWRCNNFNIPLTFDVQLKGCNAYKPVLD